MIAEPPVPMTPRIAEALVELQELISSRYPGAAFSISDGEDPEGFYLTATVDVEDMREGRRSFPGPGGLSARRRGVAGLRRTDPSTGTKLGHAGAATRRTRNVIEERHRRSAPDLNVAAPRPRWPGRPLFHSWNEERAYGVGVGTQTPAPSHVPPVQGVSTAATTVQAQVPSTHSAVVQHSAASQASPGQQSTKGVSSSWCFKWLSAPGAPRVRT